MIQENQEQDLELAEEIQEEVVEEGNEEIKKPELTPEQKRGILKRQLTKLEKEMGIAPEVKEVKPVEAKKEEYSLKDIRALSDVPDEVVDKVVGWARFNNIEIAEAKRTPEMQILIKRTQEEIATAQASNVGGGNRGGMKVPDETLIDRANREGDPDSDAEAVRLAEARFKQKFKK